MRGATERDLASWRDRRISIHAPHAGSDRHRGPPAKSLPRISIHAPHAGSDWICFPGKSSIKHFNPRSPCGERPAKAGISVQALQFQSTLPMRGATPRDRARGQACGYFNPRSPCGERPARRPHPARRAPISIHAPHAGSDSACSRDASKPSNFNPRSPCGERLLRHGLAIAASLISIHAPHAGSDQGWAPGRCWHDISIHAPHAGSDEAVESEWEAGHNFNPRSPCGERPGPSLPQERWRKFQSTLPMRGATSTKYLIERQRYISIHAPHAGSDTSPLSCFSIAKNFNPRSPCGERRGRLCLALRAAQISIHAPHAGSDPLSWSSTRRLPISIHAPHAGSDQDCRPRFHAGSISIHAPHAGSDKARSS